MRSIKEKRYGIDLDFDNQKTFLCRLKNVIKQKPNLIGITVSPVLDFNSIDMITLNELIRENSKEIEFNIRYHDLTPGIIGFIESCDESVRSRRMAVNDDDDSEIALEIFDNDSYYSIPFEKIASDTFEGEKIRIIIGKTGTFKTEYANTISNHWWLACEKDKRFMIDSDTSMDDLIDSYFSMMLYDAKRIDIKPLVWLDDIDLINPEVANELFYVLSGSQNIVKSSTTGLSLNLKDVHWLFTSSDNRAELKNRFGDKFTELITRNVITMKSYKELSKKTKKDVIHFFLSQTLSDIDQDVLFIEKGGIEYLINQTFRGANMRYLEKLIRDSVLFNYYCVADSNGTYRSNLSVLLRHLYLFTPNH